MNHRKCFFHTLIAYEKCVFRKCNKKLINLCFLLFCFANTLYGQQHPFEVKRVKFWAADYLTCTCNYFFIVENEDADFNDFCKITGFPQVNDGFLRIDTEKSEIWPLLEDVILAIDGKSTKGMSEDIFYKLLDESSTHNIELYTPQNKERKSGKIVLKDMPIWVDNIGLKPFSTMGHTWKYDIYKLKNNETNFDLIFDEDFDWSEVHTYDFALTGNDPLTDKYIMQKIAENAFDGYLTRNEEDPDVIFCISKNADKSINSTYIPPQVNVVHTGSRTQTEYNWITRKNEYVTKDSYQTIREGGYTRHDKTIDEFMEFTILDAKKLKNKLSTPPIIYQATFRRFVSNPSDDWNVKDEYSAWATWLVHPLEKYNNRFDWSAPGQLSSMGAYLNLYYSGGGTIKKVIKGSDAEKAGLREGDYFKKIELNKKDRSFYTVKLKYPTRKVEVHRNKDMKFLLPTQNHPTLYMLMIDIK